MCLDKEGRYAASGAEDGRIVVSDVGGLISGSGVGVGSEAVLVLELSSLAGAGGESGTKVTALAWGGGARLSGARTASPATLFAASLDGFVREFAVPSGVCRASVAVSPLPSPSLTPSLMPHRSGHALFAAALAVSGSLVVAAGAGGLLRVWSWQRSPTAGTSAGVWTPRTLVSEEKLVSEDIISIALHNKGRRLLTASDTSLRLWSISPGR